MNKQEYARSKVCAQQFRTLKAENTMLKNQMAKMDAEDAEVFDIIRNHRLGLDSELSKGATRRIIRNVYAVSADDLIEETVARTRRENIVLGIMFVIAIALIPIVNLIA